MGKPIPLTPSTQRSGGMLDDVIAKITEARAVMFDYGGNADEVPALRLTLEDEEGDELSPQHYKAGDPAKVQPSEDGLNFEPVDEDDEYEGIGKKTLAGTFLRALDEVSKGKFEGHARKVGDLSCLEGIVGKFEMKPKPKTGLGEQKYPDFPLITEIIEAPWGKGGKSKGGDDTASKKAKAKQKALDDDEDDEDEEDEEEEEAPASKGKKKKGSKAKAAAKDADEDDEDEDEAEDEDSIEARATAALVSALEDAGKPLARAKAASTVREAIKDSDDDWKEITTLILSDKFLKAGAKAGSWTFDGTKVGPADE